MKKIALFVGIALITIALSCTQTKKLVDTNVDLPYSQSVNVPGTSLDTSVPLPAGGVSLPFPAVGVPTHSKDFLNQYNSATDKVVSVDLKGASIEITAPSGANFDYMDSLQLYMSAVGQGEQLVAYIYGIPKGQSTLDLTVVPNVNMKDYFIQDTMYYRMTTHINAFPPKAGETMTIATILHLIANPLN